MTEKVSPLHPDKGLMDIDILSAEHCGSMLLTDEDIKHHYNFLLLQSKRRHSSTVITENNGKSEIMKTRVALQSSAGVCY